MKSGRKSDWRKSDRRRNLRNCAKGKIVVRDMGREVGGRGLRGGVKNMHMEWMNRRKNKSRRMINGRKRNERR